MIVGRVAPPKTNYVYNAEVVEVHDGDTVILSIDLGFFMWCRMPCRLLGINAPELNTAQGKVAAQFLKAMLPAGSQVTVQSTKPDKYGGRFNGMVFTPSGVNVSEAMIAKGYAAPWSGQGAKPIP